MAPEPAHDAATIAVSKDHHHDIDLSQFPPEVREALAAFDTDGSGSIGTEELALAGKLYKDSLQTSKRIRIAMIVVSVVFTIIMLLMFGVMYAAIQLAKDSVVGGNAVMATKSGATVQIASSQFVVQPDGSMSMRIVSTCARTPSLPPRSPSSAAIPPAPASHAPHPHAPPPSPPLP